MSVLRDTAHTHTYIKLLSLSTSFGVGPALKCLEALLYQMEDAAFSDLVILQCHHGADSNDDADDNDAWCRPVAKLYTRCDFCITSLLPKDLPEEVHVAEVAD